MSSVGFVGTGAIAAPMARALARAGHAVTVSGRNADVAADLASAGLGIRVASNQGVIDNSEIVFLCLRPAVWADATRDLAWREDQQVVSVMAGVPMAGLARACAPASRISVTIPYAFVEFGGCPLPVVGDPAAVTHLFGQANPVLVHGAESALRHHFAASTLVSAALGMLETGAGWLADRTGDPDSAEVYVASLVGGYLATLATLAKLESGSLAAEKRALATPETLNRQMVDGLQATGAFDGLPALLGRISASME